jgi:glycosyltransferase involved in cell wall biosynthesis
LLDKSLKDRLVSNGAIELKKFSWEKCAKETLNILQKLSTKKKTVMIHSLMLGYVF